MRPIRSSLRSKVGGGATAAPRELWRVENRRRGRPSAARDPRPAGAILCGGAPRPIRVLFVNDHLGYEGDVTHGATTYFLTTLSSFDRHLVEPLLCILRPRHPGAKRLEAHGIPLIFLGRAKWDPRALVDLIRIVREQSVDILHLSGMKSALLGAVAARLTGRPALLHVHDLQRLKPGLGLLQRLVTPWTGMALVVSEPVRRVAIGEYGVLPGRVEVLPNGIRLEMIADVSPASRDRVRRELGLGDATPVVGVAARLHPEKGQAHLIRALPALRARCPDAVLVVAGDGPARGECETLVRSLGLESTVRLLGHREDIPDLLAAVDVVVVPSWEEPFGYAALEAIAASRPVVAFAAGGLRDIVVHGNTGLLVPQGDFDGLAAAVGDILTNPALARTLGLRARRHAQRFSVEHHVRRLEEIYVQFVHRGVGSPAGSRATITRRGLRVSDSRRATLADPGPQSR